MVVESSAPGPFHPRLSDLPPVLPVFPLSGALLLPWSRLPLNIFERRYLSMVQDALGIGRMIGMVQPVGGALTDSETLPSLFSVGCAGRISSFSETPDGRLLITLTGVCRFRITEERPMTRAYRMVDPDWMPFADDLNPQPPVQVDRARLMQALTEFLNTIGMPVNDRALADLPPADLINTVAMTFPFDPTEKQALLEAPTAQHRADVLITLLEMAQFPGTLPRQ